MDVGSNFKNIHQELIDGCRLLRPESQLEVYRIYYKSMYNTAFRMLRHSAEAEDIMQESFLKAFTKIDTYQNEVSFGAWLKRIVVNTCLDKMRQHKMELSEADKFPDIEDDSPEIDCDESITVDCIKRCIDMLPEGSRVVANLYLIEGYDHDEIAEILEISNSASRTQLHRAKLKLAELIKEKQKIDI